MRRSEQSIAPVSKVRAVPLPAEQAFELFTSGMGQWWPLASHSIAGQDAIGVRFEGRVGGRIVEIGADGSEHPWADVLAWDPPHRFAVAWHPTPEPVAASILEVRFEPTDDGCTLHLEHGTWEEFGLQAGTAARDQYQPGWDSVLANYLTSAATRESSV